MRSASGSRLEKRLNLRLIRKDEMAGLSSGPCSYEMTVAVSPSAVIVKAVPANSTPMNRGALSTVKRLADT
jgi:hypothetical protein